MESKLAQCEFATTPFTLTIQSKSKQVSFAARPSPVRMIYFFLSSLLCSAPESNIRENVPLVLIPVTVTTPKSEFIQGLTERDFAVRDDGRLQKIQVDTPDTLLAPSSVVIAIQTNNITAPAL